jgi:hypothetical protein
MSTRYISFLFRLRVSCVPHILKLYRPGWNSLQSFQSFYLYFKLQNQNYMYFIPLSVSSIQWMEYRQFILYAKNNPKFNIRDVLWELQNLFEIEYSNSKKSFFLSVANIALSIPIVQGKILVWSVQLTNIKLSFALCICQSAYRNFII